VTSATAKRARGTADRCKKAGGAHRKADGPRKMAHTMASRKLPIISGITRRRQAGSREPSGCNTAFLHREAVLTPGFEDHQGHGVRQVNTAIAGAHRDVQDRLGCELSQSFGGQPFRLTAEEKRIAWAKRDVAVAGRPTGLDNPEPLGPEARKARVQTGMLVDPRHLMVIEAGTSNVRRVQGKSERVHQMQLTTGIRRQTDDVAGIRWNFGFVQDDVEHSPAQWEARL